MSRWPPSSRTGNGRAATPEQATCAGGASSPRRARSSPWASPCTYWVTSRCVSSGPSKASCPGANPRVQ
eukprot:914100-Pyramimonas_sp.AAC.1